MSNDSQATIYIEYEEIEIVEIKSSTKGYWDKSHYISRGPTGRWSKWGGPRMDLVQENIDEYWYCQSCNQKQPKDLTPMRYEYPEHEYIRICGVCFNNECETLKRRIELS